MGGVMEKVNEAVERVGIVCDWQLAEFKEEMRGRKKREGEGREEGWRKEGGRKAEEAFAWLEARTDGRVLPGGGRR